MSSYDIEQVILLLKKNGNPETNMNQIKKVGDKCFASIDARIKAAGLAAQGAAENMRLAEVRVSDAEAESKNATENLHLMNDIGVDSYKTMADVVMEVDPDDVETWQAFLFEVSKAKATTGEVPEQAYGGSIVQSDTAGFGLMHFHHIKGATYYKIWMSANPDPSVMKDYVRCTPDTFPNSHGGLVAVATGVKLWFRIQACNLHGDGIMSGPFGGLSFSPTI